MLGDVKKSTKIAFFGLAFPATAIYAALLLEMKCSAAVPLADAENTALYVNGLLHLESSEDSADSIISALKADVQSLKEHTIFCTWQ